jgi:hypothetical protein
MLLGKIGIRDDVEGRISDDGKSHRACGAACLRTISIRANSVAQRTV